MKQSASGNSRSGPRRPSASSSSDRWNQAVIVKAISGLHRRKKPLWSRRIREENPALFAAAIHWFGSYRSAVTAAGIQYESIQKSIPGRWNIKTVGQELRRLHRQKKPLHHAAIERENPALVLAAYRYFGSYGSAVTAAGLDYDRIRVRSMPSWDKTRVVRRLQELEQSQTGLWKRSVRRVDPYLDRAADRCFGSYQKAVRASGVSSELLTPPPYRFWSPQRIVDELKTTYQKNPRLLKPARLTGTRQRKLLRACRRRFGSYRSALDAAGISYQEVVTPPVMNAQEIVNNLTQLFEKGRDLRYSQLRLSNRRLLDSSRRVFGSYENAMRSAGLDYPPAPPMRHWTATLVLRTLRELNLKRADLRYRHFRKARLPLFEAARHYFGTYLAAIHVAGIDYTEMVSKQLERELPGRKHPESR
jgi:hypothetical protein